MRYRGENSDLFPRNGIYSLLIQTLHQHAGRASCGTAPRFPGPLGQAVDMPQRMPRRGPLSADYRRGIFPVAKKATRISTFDMKIFSTIA